MGWGETFTVGRLQAEPLGLADHLHGLLAVWRVEAVEEQHPVEVVGLVLDGTGQQVGALDGDRLAVHVEAAGDHGQRALAVDGQAGDRQAALRAVLDVLGEVRTGLTRWPTSPSTFQVNTRRPTPICGAARPGAGGVEHGVGEVLDEAAQLLVEVDDLDGLLRRTGSPKSRMGWIATRRV